MVIYMFLLFCIVSDDIVTCLKRSKNSQGRLIGQWRKIPFQTSFSLSKYIVYCNCIVIIFPGHNIFPVYNSIFHYMQVMFRQVLMIIREIFDSNTHFFLSIHVLSLKIFSYKTVSTCIIIISTNKKLYSFRFLYDQVILRMPFD